MKPSTLQPAFYKPSPLMPTPSSSVTKPLPPVSAPRAVAVLTSLDAYDGTTGGLGTTLVSGDEASSSTSGSKAFEHGLLASVVGTAAGLLAGEWSWRQRPNSLAKKLAENKRLFLDIVKNPLTATQLEDIGKLGELARVYGLVVDSCRNNKESLRLNLPNTSETDEALVDEIRLLLRTKEYEALQLLPVERALAKALKGTPSSIEAALAKEEGVLKESLFFAETFSADWFAWLRINQKELMSIDILGQLSQVARHAKLIAATVAGCMMGAMLVLLHLGQQNTTKKEQQLAFTQHQLLANTLPTNSPKKAIALQIDSPLPSKPMVEPEMAKTVVAQPFNPETIQAFWQKQREH